MPMTTRAFERLRIFSAAAQMASSSVALMRWGSSVQPVKSAPRPDFSARVLWAAAAAA